MLENDRDSNNEPYWFLISSEWLYLWKCFISNRIASIGNLPPTVKDSVKMSSNPKVGILPPGPISNQDLFSSNPVTNTIELKKGL